MVCRGTEPFDSLLIQHFAETNWVITFQRRENDQRVQGIDSRADDVERVLYYLDLETAQFVSHSSGAIATTTVGLCDPSRFRSYVRMKLSPKPAMDMAWWCKWAAEAVESRPLSDHRS